MDDFDHTPFMARALELAAKGGVAVRPNPQVGAVVVRDRTVVGEGYHRAYGEAHAEANALRSSGTRSSGATVYCTLEPCCFSDAAKHQPPCTRELIAAGIDRMVIGQIDPNPKVSGRGIAQLRDAGIAVEVGVLAHEAALLNPDFNTEMAFGRPFVHVKWAQTLDGYVATTTGDSKWITDERARDRAHQLRSENDGVLVGLGTVSEDDPLLTARNDHIAAQPRPIVLDRRLRISQDSRLVRERGRELIVVTEERAPLRAEQTLSRHGVKVVRSETDDNGLLSIQSVLKRLHGLGLRTVLVEGGSRVIGSMLDSGIWDRITVFTAPLVLRTGIPARGRPEDESHSSRDGLRIADALRLAHVSVEEIGGQTMVSGYNPAWLEEVCGVHRTH